MCPSMADGDTYTSNSKPKKLSSEVSSNHANPRKHFHHFLYKSIIITIFLVIVPLLPSQAPEFVNQNLQYSGSWELLQLIFVGIAVSYGLFSKRNNETGKEHSSSASKFDNAQSYVARLPQVSSVFDDNKIRTWNSQYHRGEPRVVVAKESPVLEKQKGATSRIDEKPLLLPVRSLKSRVFEPNERETMRETSVNNASISRPSSNSGSKRFSNSSGKPINGEFAGLSPLNVDENTEANAVLRSPIPWRSRSGRMEVGEDEDGLTSYSLPSSVEDSELKKFKSERSIRSQASRSSRLDSGFPSPNKSSTPPTTPPSCKTLSPSLSFSTECQAKSVEDVVRRKIKSVEDVVRRKIYVKSSPPPAPPPPPPFYRKSPLEKSSSSVMNTQDSSKKELRRSVRSMPNEFIEPEIEVLSRRRNSGPESRPRTQNDVSLVGKSVRTIKPSEPTMRASKSKEYDADVINKVAKEGEATSLEKREFTKKLIRELQMPGKEEYIEKVDLETDESSEISSEDDYFEESVGSSGNEVLATANMDNATDEGPDVDKKADEFIAKFREQIRLQRIESIRRSTEQHARKQSR